MSEPIDHRARTPITDADVAFYVEQGFLVVEQLVGAETVDALRDEAVRFARGDYPLSNPPDLPADATAADAAAAILAVHFPHWVSQVSLDAVHHAGVVDVVSRIAGAHLPHWDGAAKCMQTMLFLKPPGMPGQAWHQDERYIPTRDRSLVGAWIALDDADEANGCLRVLPGSHRPGVIHPTADHGRPEEFDPTDEVIGVDSTDEVIVEVAAGDVVFFNGYLLHRSLRNATTDRFRRALVTHYMSAQSLLPWQTSGDTATADQRLVVQVAGTDPHEHKGYDEPPATTFVRPATGTYENLGTSGPDARS